MSEMKHPALVDLHGRSPGQDLAREVAVVVPLP